MMRKWNTCKNNYQCVVWEKGVVVGKKKALPFLSQFPPILLSCLDSPFCGPDYLRTWNRLIWHKKGYFFHNLQCTSFKFQRVCKTIAAHSVGPIWSQKYLVPTLWRRWGCEWEFSGVKAHTFIGQWLVEPSVSTRGQVLKYFFLSLNCKKILANYFVNTCTFFVFH